MGAMDIDAARQFIRTNHRGVLITFGNHGRVQSSPVLATIDDAGALAISTRETAYKVGNLRRDPRATYCGFTDRFFGDWVQVGGTVEVVSLPEAMDGLVAYYRSISGEHENWEEYRSAMRSQRRVLVRMMIESAGPDRSG